MGALLLAFVAEIGIITYRDIAGSQTQKTGHVVEGLPLPADYLAACAFFGALGLVPKDSGGAKVASLLGWGIVLATAANVMPLVNSNKASGTTVASSLTSTKATA